MSVTPRWRLRTFLYSLTAATILPLALLLYWSAYSQFRQAEEAAASQAYSLAQIASNNAQSTLADAEKLLRMLAARIQARRSTVKGCDPIFAEFLNLHPQYANLSQAGPDGYITCSTTPLRDGRPAYVGDTEWFNKVYGQQKFIAAEPYKGLITGRLVSVLAYPMRDDDGSMIGSLQLPIDLLNFQLMPGTSALPDSIVVSIFNSAGVLVARSRDAGQFVGKNLRGAAGVELLLRDRNGTGKSRTSQGVERIFGFVEIPGTDWLAIAGISTDVVLKSARETVRSNVIGGSVVLLFVLLLALYVANRISKPMMQMQRTATRVSGGAHGERALIGGPKEVADVALQFNEMLDAIERNLTEQRAREEQIYHLAFFDTLTGLPNRRLLVKKVEEAIRNARSSDQVGAVIYINLDRFKDINDARGHLAGDLFLQSVARSLESILSPDDMLARIGGDEFVYLATGLGASQEHAVAAALHLGEQLQALLQRPFQIADSATSSSASIGITLFPKIGDTSDTLLHEADIAMYEMKQAGRNRIAFFEATMHLAVIERIAMEADLQHAIGSRDLELHMQSQVDCLGALRGVELLLRWNDPVRGAVSPAVFIPLAEQSDLIVRLGTWVLEQGCLIQRRMENAGIDVPLSINVSPRQFRFSGFVDQVRRLLERTGTSGSRLIFEVTEGLLIEDLESTVARMNQLSELGIRFSIDDFGTGYSSLAYLNRLPLYELKIDKSFIDDVPEDASDAAIVHCIFGMAVHLGLRVVAEGVENSAQAKFLIAGGCDAMQGYLYARPLPADEWFKSTCREKIAEKLA